MPAQDMLGSTAPVNRRERRRRGMTKRRVRKTGTLASAGVLLSAGLFGAYVGNPRLQRAYASPCTPSVPATDDTTFRAALDDSTVTCIEISGNFTLTSDLPTVVDDSWVGGPRQTDGLTIFGSGAGDDTVNGGGYRGLDLQLSGTGPVDVALSDVTMSGFDSLPHNGSALHVYTFGGTPQDVVVNLTNVAFTDNYSFRGAAVFVNSNGQATATLASTDFSDNIANNKGGAFGIEADDTVAVTMANSTFTGNSAMNGAGGAVYIFSDYADTTLTLDQVTLRGNFAKYSGGAVAVGARYGIADANVTDSYFADDSSAGGLGGALYVMSINGDARASTENSSFLNNETGAGSGGAIALTSYSSTSSGDVRMDDTGSVFTRNHSSGSGPLGGQGGAVFLYGSGYGTVTGSFTDSTFTLNSSSRHGGAINAKEPRYDAADVYLTRSTLSGNTAGDSGGGAYIWGRGFVSQSSIVDNTANANSSGGGLSARGDVYVISSYIGSNEAFQAGGVYAGGDMYLYFSTVYDDTAVGGAYPSALISLNGIKAVGSAVGRQSGSGPLFDSPLIDDSYSVSTVSSSDDSFTGPGSINVSPGGLDLAPLDDTVTPGHGGRGPRAASPLLPGAPGALGTGVVFDQLGVDRRLYPTYTIGARQLAVAPPTPPTPPSPTPSYPPGAPTNVKASAGIGEATVTWSAPSYAGSYPITDYEVTSSPGSQSCLSKTTSCTVTGLTGGTTYTFTVRALNGAGWGLYSAPSNAVTTPAKSILITGSRDASDDRYVRVQGTTTDLAGRQVTPYVRFPGQTGATAGTGVRTVSEAGTFAWKRKTGKRIEVYFQHAEVRSNTVTISAR